MHFTGERFIPNETDKQLEIEHKQRYLSVEPLAHGKVVLDAACGEGYGSYILSKHAAQVYGIDISIEAIANAQITYSADNLEFRQGSVDRLEGFEDQSIDIVVSFETIEHIDESMQTQFLLEIKRVLKPDGILVMSTPDKYRYTDVPGYHNPFHVKEFYKHEFLAFLKSQFPYTELYYQKNEIVSIIGIGAEASNYRLLDGADSILNNGKYLVAVCSLQPIVNLRIHSVMTNPEIQYEKLIDRILTLQNEVEERNAHLKKLDGEIEETRNLLRLNSQEIANKSELIQELSRTKENLAEELKEKNRLNDAVIEELHALHEMQLEQQLTHKDTQISNLNGHIEILLEQERKLNNILSSGGWRALKRYYKLRDAIVPANSKRKLIARMFKLTLTQPGKIVRNLNRSNIKKFIYYLKTERSGLLENRVENYLERQSDAPIREIEVNHHIDTSQKLVFPEADNPVVSIVIPVYNQWHYTYGCLAAILQHTNGIDYEIIVADDMSTDDTVNIGDIVENITVVRDGTNRGFLLNCNNAAQCARGKYIFFLNNDTNVQANWLSSLLELIESDASIGMVGSKLVYPDGRLQEAGGIIWNDASGWNYGRLDDPNKPEYNYVREVDYISGAAIMIRSSLWKQIGGFDEKYVPAYYEDSDLAFEVRKHGYKVVYQPQSIVVHFEGVSHGTDVSSGMKSYQVTNKNKFLDKWKDVLDQDHFPNAVNVFGARDRSSYKPTILVVDHYVPHYDKDAGSRTMYQYLKLFVEMGLNVKFVGDNFYKHEPYTSELEQLGIEVLYGSEMQKTFAKWLKLNGENIDYVYLLRPHIAINYIDLVKSLTRAKILYNGTDLHYIREARRYWLDKNPAILKAAREIRKQEYELMNKSDVVITISNYEKQLLSRKLPSKTVKVIPTYLYETEDLPLGKRNDFEQRRNITFVGGFAHSPNTDGVLWFTKEIFPIIRKMNPGIKLNVIGSNPPADILELSSEYINITGFVPDEVLENYYGESRIIVAPLRYGAGVKGKIIEAIAHGVPVVTTSVGAEGIVGNEEILVVANTAEQFAREIVELYSDSTRWSKLREQLIHYGKSNFGTDYAISILKDEFTLLKEQI